MGDVKRHDEIQGEIIHEYDGIEEADNALPKWWLLTFYGAIVFSIGYWFYYEEFEVGPTQAEVFAAEMADRAAEGGADEATLLVLAEDTATIEEGRQAFSGTCAACHGDRGQGEIGPNLTDDRWLHGGSAMAIYTSIKEGIPATEAQIPGSAGMPAWGAQLGERPVQAVTAYLLSIRDTNVPGREAEGEPWDPNAAPSEAGGAEGTTEGAAAPDTEPASAATNPESEPAGA